MIVGKKMQNIMNRYEQEYYNDISKIAKALEKIAKLLDEKKINNKD